MLPELLIAAVLTIAILLWRWARSGGPRSMIAMRNWERKRVRTLGAILAISLGTGAVVWVTCCYESVSQTVSKWAGGFIGTSHINIESALGKYDALPQRMVARIEQLRDGTTDKPGYRDKNILHVAPMLVQRVKATTADKADYERSVRDGLRWWPSMDDLDVHGIDLEREFAIRDWNEMLVEGRMLRPDDENACVLEAQIADEQHIGVGDMVLIWRSSTTSDEPVAFEVVGLLKRRRIARFLKGIALVRLTDLQRATRKYAMVNAIDISLRSTERNHLLATRNRVFGTVRGICPHVQVRTAATRHRLVQNALDQQRMVLVLMSSVAILTALFIILSTLSMGMVERIGQMGLLRCVGVTRAGLAYLTLVEVVPLGVIGVILGIPVGLALTALSVWLVPEYVGKFAVSLSGIGLACGAGLATTLVAGALPALAAVGVSPLEATRPRARGSRAGWLFVLVVLTGLLLLGQMYVMNTYVQRNVEFTQWAAIAIVCLYLVYAFAAPLLVWLASHAIVWLAAILVRVPLRLLQDQIGRAVWRSAGIVCGLMVGLSLIVGLMVFQESFRSAWQFPKQFPEAYIWSFEQINVDVQKAIDEIPGIKDYTIANAPNVLVEERPIVGADIVHSFTFFLGIDPDTFFDLLHLEFIDGDRETAIAKLKQGGHVIVAADFARARRKGVKNLYDENNNIIQSNQVRVLFNNRWTVFNVAGVIDSPALDIAASYFQVQSEARVASTGSVIGTNDDLKKRFGIDGAKLVLLNFDLPPMSVPPNWPPPKDTPDGRKLKRKYYDEKKTLAARWRNYREEHTVLNRLCGELGSNQVFYGTARELKDEIDSELRSLTLLLAAVPTVALIVAALGVANLMTANVASRRKQIAVMRAVGATRGLILRTVVGESLVLGLLGSLLGLGLGMHLAWNITIMTARMWGILVPLTVPWTIVGVAVALTMGLCVLAGIAPARHASRTNVIDALHVS